MILRRATWPRCVEKLRMLGAVETWHAWLMGPRFAVLLLLGAACSTPGSSHDTDAAVVAADALEPPGLITIRVRNDGQRALYVQASGWSGQEVTAILKLGGIAIGHDTCEICNCATCPSCAVCGRSIAHVAELLPGAALDFSWDQTDWSVIAEGCRPTLACEQPALVPSGPLTARARYSDTFTTTTMYGPEESFIGPSITAEIVFDHPAADVVVVPIL